MGLEVYRILYGSVDQGSTRGVVHVELIKRKNGRGVEPAPSPVVADNYFVRDVLGSLPLNENASTTVSVNKLNGVASERVCVPQLAIAGNGDVAIGKALVVRVDRGGEGTSKQGWFLFHKWVGLGSRSRVSVKGRACQKVEECGKEF